MPTVSGVGGSIQRGVAYVTWASITTTASVGRAYTGAAWRQKTVQVLGTFASKGHVQIQGSNNLISTASVATWTAMRDINGNTLDITAAVVRDLQGTPNLIRPKLVSGVAGSTNLTVRLVSNSTFR